MTEVADWHYSRRLQPFEKNRLARVAAEMRIPGRACLQSKVEPSGGDV